MTVKELAKICNVSPATVSRAIGGQAPVNPETRRKINEAINKYNYTPRESARTKKRKIRGMIGVIPPSADHPFSHCLLMEIQKQLKPLDRTMLILPEQGGIGPNEIRRLPLDGVILLSAEIDQEIVSALKHSGFGIVMCSSLPLTKNLSSVRVDDVTAAYDGVRYLVELGHRNIGFITDSPKSFGSGFQRIAGSRKAMEDFGIPADSSVFFSGNCDYASGFEGALKLMKANPRLTAIFAHSDIGALGAITALTDRGFKVPGDVSVLGFDGIRFGEQSRPRLTCVHQPVSELVGKTLELLMDMIENPGKELPMSITLKTTIKVRESCGKARSNAKP